MACKECIHFGICKKGFPWADGYGGGWCEDFRLNPDFVKLKPQPLEAGTDLNELTEGRYYVEARNAVPQPFYSDPEECKKACELLRTAGYNAVTNGNIILVKAKEE